MIGRGSRVGTRSLKVWWAAYLLGERNMTKGKVRRVVEDDDYERSNAGEYEELVEQLMKLVRLQSDALQAMSVALGSLAAATEEVEDEDGDDEEKDAEEK
jgi:hypothetical protein